MRKQLTAFMALVLLPVVAHAQSGASPVSAKGFSLGVALNGSAIESDEASDGTDSGAGVNLALGWGFTPRLVLFLEGSAASIDSEGETWTLSHGDIGLRYLFPLAGQKFSPFIEGAFSSRSGTQENVELQPGQTGDLELSGGGFTLGGGFHYFFSPRAAFTAGLRWTTGEFTTVKFGNISVEGLDIDATTTRISLGLNWFFGNR